MSSTYKQAGLVLEESLFNHLKTISFKYSAISPALSSHYMSRVQDYGYARKVLENETSTPICPFCGLIRKAENTLVRVLPKIKETKALVKLRNKSRRRRSHLGTRQKTILKLADSKTNQMVSTCSVCRKKVRTRMKLPTISSSAEIQIPKIKKKSKNKRVKDPNAGLIIPNSSSVRRQIHKSTEATGVQTMASGRRNVIKTTHLIERKNINIKKWNDPFRVPVVNTLEAFLSSVC